MRRGFKIALGVLVALFVLVAINAVVTGRDTEPAEVTVPGGEIVRLAGGDLQIVEHGPRSGAPIVLIHGFTAAIDWWDAMVPELDAKHRVVVVDLLGHGGSEKPSTGYGMEEQADLVAEALARLDVRGATAVGHSMGGSVATALAERFPEIVERLVIVDQAPDESYSDGLGLLAALTFKPVLGEALWRIKSDFTVEEGMRGAFAPGYEVPDGFVEDLRRLTYTAYEESSEGDEAYTDAIPLDRRVERAGVPLLAIFGEQDDFYDSHRSLEAYAGIGAKIAMIPGAGHSPNVEKPRRTAEMVLSFAAEGAKMASARHKLQGALQKPDAVRKQP